MNLNVSLRKKKKVLTSVVALSTSIGMFGDVFSMDQLDLQKNDLNVRDIADFLRQNRTTLSNNPLNYLDKADLEKLYNSIGFTNLIKDNDSDIFMLGDNLENPNSTAYYSKNADYNPDERRLLSLDGGGIRGLIEIMQLAVLEKIMNDPINDEIRFRVLKKSFGCDVFDWNKVNDLEGLGDKIHTDFFQKEKSGAKADMMLNDFNRRISAAKKNNGRMPVYIRDFFDAAAGTSTGSILAAGLFTNNANYLNQENLTTIDIAKLYYRYGKEVFDKHKRYGSNILTAKYDNTGLKKMLGLYFQDCKISDVYKPLFVVACSDTIIEPVVFSSIDKKKDRFKNIKMVDATLSSASAPTFFESHVFNIGGSDDEYYFSDGGVKANNPCGLALQDFQLNDSQISKKKGSSAEKLKYGIYSFGTGDTKYTNNTAKYVNAGLLTIAADITPYMMEMDLKERCNSAISNVKIAGNSLETFIRLNPKLAAGMDLLDVTTTDYINYMSYQAFRETEGAVFMTLCLSLGLKMPATNQLKTMQRSIVYDMNQLTFSGKIKKWSEISDLEKDYVFSKISENDFEFYEDLKNGLGTDFDAFFESFKDHFKSELEKKSKFDLAKDYLYYTVLDYNPIQKIKRGSEFHKMTNEADIVSHLTIDQLDSLENLTAILERDYEKKKKAFWAFGLTDLSFENKVTVNNQIAMDFAYGVYTKFIDCLETLQNNQPVIDGEIADYTSDWGIKSGKIGGNYVDFLATIYIKDILKDIQYDVTKIQLEYLYSALIGPVSMEVTKDNLTSSSRVNNLSTALRQYIDRKFPKI